MKIFRVCKGKFVPVCAVITYVGMEVELHSFLAFEPEASLDTLGKTFLATGKK